MNTIEIMLEALKSTRPSRQHCTSNEQWDAAMDFHDQAIALGEAKLQRRQDAINAVEFWISCDTDKRDAYCALLTLLKEEIK